jgi:hypothetical protein
MMSESLSITYLICVPSQRRTRPFRNGRGWTSDSRIMVYEFSAPFRNTLLYLKGAPSYITLLRASGHWNISMFYITKCPLADFIIDERQVTRTWRYSTTVIKQ